MSNSEQNQIESAIAAGALAATLDERIGEVAHPELETVRIPVAVNSEGDVVPLHDVIKELDERLPWPRRRAGHTRLTDAESLIAFVKRWGDANTVIYANTNAMAFAVVMNDAPAGPTGAAWRDHRADYACPRSPEWVAWTSLDAKALTQTQFADFLEERLADLVAADGFPRPMDMLAVARALNIKTKGTFQREMNPTNGDYLFVHKSETTEDSTQIPRAFLLAVPVFEGGPRYQIEARVRFVINEGRPAFSFVLHRRAEIERDAFNEVRTTIASGTSTLVLSGTP